MSYLTNMPETCRTRATRPEQALDLLDVGDIPVHKEDFLRASFGFDTWCLRFAHYDLDSPC